MKILLFDIETSPILANIWSLWSEAKDMKFVDIDWHLLSFSAKWLDEKTTITKTLTDYPSYKKDSRDDRSLLLDLWTLLDQADIVVTHNGIKYDNRKINSRFIQHGILPPSPYRMVDTLQVAKAYFSFTSNRLDALGQLLGVGRKVDTGGFELWRGCMSGDMKSWEKMRRYNKQDVLLLEKVYLKLLPYMQKHPNVAVSGEIDSTQCPCCGSNKMIKRGFSYTNLGKYSRYRCGGCGKWSRGRSNLLDKDVRANLVSNF